MMYGRVEPRRGPSIFGFLFTLLLFSIIFFGVLAFIFWDDVKGLVGVPNLPVIPWTSDDVPTTTTSLNATTTTLNETTSVTTTVDVDVSYNSYLHFIDVGQGDSILVKSGDYEALVDCGGRGAADDVIKYLHTVGVGRLEYLIVTHPDADHVGGCIDLLDEFEVPVIYYNGDTKDTQTWRDFEAQARHETSEFNVLGVGQSIGVGSIRLLNANNGLNVSDYNEGSIVLHGSGGVKSFLLTGDCEGLCENRSVDFLGSQIESDVLKVAHHGGDGGSSMWFVREVNPSVAVISVGRNAYGHPSEDVVERLEDVGAVVRMTVLEGDIRIGV